MGSQNLSPQLNHIIIKIIKKRIKKREECGLILSKQKSTPNLIHFLYKLLCLIQLFFFKKSIGGKN